MNKPLFYAFVAVLLLGSVAVVGLHNDKETGVGSVDIDIHSELKVDEDFMTLLTQPVPPKPTTYRERLEQMASRGEIRVVNMKITAYSATYEDCGKDDGITASGEKIHEGVVAADPSIPFGTKLYIEGVGIVVVKDRGGAIRGNILDLYIPDPKNAEKWGVQHRKVYFI